MEAGGRRSGSLGGTGEEVTGCAPCHQHHMSVSGRCSPCMVAKIAPCPMGVPSWAACGKGGPWVLLSLLSLSSTFNLLSTRAPPLHLPPLHAITAPCPLPPVPGAVHRRIEEREEGRRGRGVGWLCGRKERGGRRKEEGIVRRDGGGGERVCPMPPTPHVCFWSVLTLHGGQYRPMPYGRAFSGSVW